MSALGRACSDSMGNGAPGGKDLAPLPGLDRLRQRPAAISLGRHYFLTVSAIDAPAPS